MDGVMTMNFSGSTATITDGNMVTAVMLAMRCVCLDAAFDKFPRRQNAVNEPIFFETVKNAVNRNGICFLVFVRHEVYHIVGGDRLCGLVEHLQDLLARCGDAKPVLPEGFNGVRNVMMHVLVR